jgi:carboxylesterase
MTADILPGCEPFSAVGAPSGVLVLHGFTGNPASLRSLAEALAAAGLTVELPRLPGHGTSIEDLMTTDWNAWTATALEVFDDLAGRCERVAVVGLSMGGGLAAFVAERRDVAGGVFINPFVKPPDPALLEGLDQLLAAGLETFDSIGSDIKKEGAVEASYPATPLRAARSLFVGVADVHAALGDITAPCLVLQSRDDHVVPAENGDDFVAMVCGPVERIWLEDSYHVATMDNDQELVEQTTVSFVRKVLGA